MYLTSVAQWPGGMKDATKCIFFSGRLNKPTVFKSCVKPSQKHCSCYICLHFIKPNQEQNITQDHSSSNYISNSNYANSLPQNSFYATVHSVYIKIPFSIYFYLNSILLCIMDYEQTAVLIWTSWILNIHLLHFLAFLFPRQEWIWNVIMKTEALV